MNLIICNEKCRHMKDGYCSLEGGAMITNALASPCCYYENSAFEKAAEDITGGDADDKG